MSKYRQVKVNFQPEVHVKLKAIADSRGVTIAELIRSIIGTGIDKAPIPKPKRVHKVLPDYLLNEYFQQGKNLNQISKRCNMIKAVDRLTYEAVMAIKKQQDEYIK